MKPYRFLDEADAEFQEQISYYDEQVAGLGDKFLGDVESVVSQIRQYPESGRQVSRNVRVRVLRIFKHNIYYVNSPAEIIVVAVAPHRRKPGYWRKRLEKLQ